MKNLIIIAILLIIASCSKSNVVIKPIQEPQEYIIDLSFIKFEAVLNGDTLNVTITNLSHAPIAVNKPWFGPCSTILVYSQKTGYSLNGMGSAFQGSPIKLDPGEKKEVKILTKDFDDNSYRVVYKPYNSAKYSSNQVECISTTIKN